ncbi:MAG TPA: SusD/RagB family nutrient-binding outer membrane lipoprotein, partial [Flavisolibacter sp.]|nr:SusD/RagB family nutrient-binding outer membrane lipoprotein [Flavisolibacter sp.]
TLKGLGNLFPKYDDQKKIYESLIPLLDTAIANIKANPFTGTFGTYDITKAGSLGNGNRTKWIKFANTLKLRILIRQSRIANRDAYIVPELQKIVAEGTGFLDAGQDMAVNPGYVQSTGKQNPFYERWGYTAAGAKQSLGRYPRPTKYLVDEVLKKTNDTFRLKRIAYAKGGESSSTPGVSSTTELTANYVGVPYGAPSGYTAGTTSYLGPAVITKSVYNNSLYLITAAESQFLLAEAAQRYGAQVTLPKSAKQYYEQGVMESFRLLGVANATDRANTLLTSGFDLADWSASPDKLKAIWMQKWLALVNYNGMEAWTEYRRTGFPNIPLSVGAPTTQPVPVRLYYPNTEVGANSNTPKQASDVVFTSRIFWDVD